MHDSKPQLESTIKLERDHSPKRKQESHSDQPSLPHDEEQNHRLKTDKDRKIKSSPVNPSSSHEGPRRVLRIQKGNNCNKTTKNQFNQGNCPDGNPPMSVVISPPLLATPQARNVKAASESTPIVPTTTTVAPTTAATTAITTSTTPIPDNKLGERETNELESTESNLYVTPLSGSPSSSMVKNANRNKKSINSAAIFNSNSGDISVDNVAIKLSSNSRVHRGDITATAPTTATTTTRATTRSAKKSSNTTVSTGNSSYSVVEHEVGDEDSWGKFTKDLVTPSKVNNPMLQKRNLDEITGVKYTKRYKKTTTPGSADTVEDEVRLSIDDLESDRATKGSSSSGSSSYYEIVDPGSCNLSGNANTKGIILDSGDLSFGAVEKPSRFQMFDQPLYDLYNGELGLIRDKLLEEIDEANSGRKKEENKEGNVDLDLERIDKVMDSIKEDMERWAMKGFQMAREYESVIRRIIGLRMKFSYDFLKLLKGVNRYATGIEGQSESLKDKGSKLMDYYSDIIKDL